MVGKLVVGKCFATNLSNINNFLVVVEDTYEIIPMIRKSSSETYNLLKGKYFRSNIVGFTKFTTFRLGPAGGYMYIISLFFQKFISKNDT